MIEKLFNTYFLEITDELIASSASDNNVNWKNNNLLNYLFQTSKHPLTNVKFTYTFIKKLKKLSNLWRHKLCLHFPTSHIGNRFLHDTLNHIQDCMVS